MNVIELYVKLEEVLAAGKAEYDVDYHDSEFGCLDLNTVIVSDHTKTVTLNI